MATDLFNENLELLMKEDLFVSRTAITIAPTDTLFVIDMQNDFVPGGAFGVAEGDATVPIICNLMESFASKKATILASRDYHPVDHCSFAPNGGPFPPHCVQGDTGSYFVDGIAATLNPLVAEGKAAVVFKGFSKDIDSFGALTYTEQDVADGRVSRHADGDHCGTCWTGGFVLFSSTQKTNCNAPPDVMAILGKKSVAEVVGAPSEEKRFFVCGLALDFCVLDTALNAVKAGYSNVSIVIDAARAAHIPGVGTFGSGFLSDPATVAAKLKEAKISLILSTAFQA